VHVLPGVRGRHDLHLSKLRRGTGAPSAPRSVDHVNDSLVSADFAVPVGFETECFVLRPLTIHDVVKDYDAMVSRGGEHVNLTLEQNLIDLGWHQVEFQRRSSFTYTVMSTDGTRCLGCVYIYPSRTEAVDADIHLWVRGDEQDTGLDGYLYDSIRRWIDDTWCFNRVAYPQRSD
jgi:hypothetical protein